MKYTSFISILCIITSSTCVASEQFAKALMNHKKNIALIIAYKGYQPTEYNETKRVINQAGFKVTTVSTKPGKAYATDGSKTMVDKALNKFNYQDYDGIFIIGGPGACTELDKEPVYTIIRNAYKADKLVGAICYSPRILAHAGILQGKQATGWNDDSNLNTIFKQHGVIYNEKPVITDGKIITADGPSSAIAFGQAIVQALQH